MTTSPGGSMKTKRRVGDRTMAGGRFLVFTASLMFLLVAPASRVWAGTAVWYGIITHVDLEAKGKIDGKGEDGKASAYCVLWLLIDSNNGDSVTDGRFLRYPLPDDKDERVARHRYYLDGKKSTRSEAAKVGHMVCWHRGTTAGIHFEAWSSFPKQYAQVWRFPDADADPKQAIWTLSLSPGLRLPARLAVSSDKERTAWSIKTPETVDTSTTREGQFEGGAMLKLVTVNGRVTHGYAKLNSRFWHYFVIQDCDAAVKDGRLTGSIPIRVLLYPLESAGYFVDAQGKPAFRTTVTIQLDVSADKKGVVTGTYTGGFSPTSGRKPESAQASVLGCLTKPAIIREPRRALVRIGAETFGFQLRADGTLDPDCKPLIRPFNKALGDITAETATGSLHDGILRMEMTAPQGKWCKKVALEGWVIDDEIYGISQQSYDPMLMICKGVTARQGGFHGRLQPLDEPYPLAVPTPALKDEVPKEAPSIWVMGNTVCNFSAVFALTTPHLLTVGDRPVCIEGVTDRFSPRWTTLGMKNAGISVSQ